ncbi:recombinase family protein [Limosilactobacillus reuteri]|uniref:recombinase family protein n=1 Tax=Limosilactobacillus reuteri TaxID=1598 RepID=UPI001E571150|nr:recombinase family protein [Limosilactobacillus reuteri]MCC4488483.1 recombinase family protein [Limosilactobacillus reuteri]MCC4492961.1 recombinase family protein [Limosilactobacillus reuteri]MCC4495181.1 recombinase family protein [Limosilactobacillus reuteri]
MAMYAYIAGTTNDDINDEGSIACQLDFLQQTNVDYDAYYIDTFTGVSRARFQLQKLLMIVKPGDMIDVMDVSNMTSNIRELSSLLYSLDDLQITIYSDDVELDVYSVRDQFTIAMMCRAETLTMMQRNFNKQKMCHLKHRIELHRNKRNKKITRSDYQIYKLLMSSDYKTAQRKTGLSRSTLYRLKKRIQKRK